MAKRRSITAFILMVCLITLSLAACDTQRGEDGAGGGITSPSPYTTASPGAGMSPSPTGSPSGNLSSFDQNFMMDAARSGMMEVQLGNMASQKASNSDVKRLGQRIATDHSQVNQNLQQLASSLNVTLPQELTSDQQQIVSRLQDLSGREFDREFVSQMITAHTRDISEFERAANQATNPELKQLASQTLPTLREHLQLARSAASKVGVKTSPTP